MSKERIIRRRKSGRTDNTMVKIERIKEQTVKKGSTKHHTEK